MVNTQAKHPYADLAVKTDEEDVVLGQMIQVILDDIWLLLGIALVVIALAGLYCYVAKPVYSADAQVRVEASDNTSQALTQTQTGAMINSGPPTPPTDAEIEIIKSRGVVAPVVEQFKLNSSVTPNTFPILGAIAARLATPGHPGKPWLGLSSYAWGGEEAKVDSIEVTPALEGKKLTLTAGADGGYTLADPDGFPLVRGRVGESEQGGGVTIDVSKLVARPGTRFTVIRQNDLDAITAFQSAIQVAEQGKQTGVIQISLEGKDPEQTAQIANALAQSYLHQHVTSKQAEATKMLEFLKNEEPRLKSDLERAEAELTQYQRTSGSINASDEAKVYLEGSVQYEQQIAAQRLQLAALAQRYTDEHPLVIAAKQQLGQLEAERAKYDGKFRGLPATEVKAVALQRNAKVAEDIYVLLLNRVQELSVQKAGTGGNIRLVDAALRPGVPVKPKKMLILSAATLLGLILGTGVVFLRRNLFHGIEDPDRVERAFNLPLYGLVPMSAEQTRFDAADKGNRVRPILACARPKDLSVESLRSLRTAMQFALMDAKNRVIVLTGPTPGIGKSFLAVNLAALVAHSGKRVLLIDADMRRGTLERHFGTGGRSGLSELLSDQVALEEAIRETPVPGLSFIPCGARPPNPSELLMSPRLSQYLDGLAKRYDMVIVDSPPILAVTDAMIFGELAGSTFLVLRSGMHTEGEISDAIKRLRTAGVQLQGGIFNGVPARTRGYGRGYAAVHEYLSA
ncbi:polysaccharide biosynthesis tyrosine autokinase [Burkholderia thailandensis]|uniref:Putative tyrosine-protein kinase EpsB n=1 Tax=Burkholderia thailandensis (strain ATCC 700388 / DSM 13276 / CCUG 48851 / CIP 106301 / E264) TaxID=271848 RepID=Q2T7V2_BURTA|nr:polysaccharide biosynthesis tyrosine autokinase [Burkholderia thailandensis]ABC34437.1 exopolysaccharide tyrosine-protein kinase, putative [Burkholderia thailandensis E264]AHI75932.1 capsular exopolysaccharide family domain protein [Burkholderia thailandensis 2002721723]AHI81055.1 capsular exopolysaccharide family domain protein [Burkholderia thailandensis E444]AIC90914.1 capsular exopolysaccharide family domain protein [Burkholderia thailandensis USAMRU Malaysia \